MSLQIGFNIKTRATPAKTQKLWELAEAATVALGQVDQFEVVEKVNELASGPDGLKREALAEAYKLDLVKDKDKLDILEKFFVVGTTYRRDMANVESLRVMPSLHQPVYTEGIPKYWAAAVKAHRVAFLVAQQCNKHRYCQIYWRWQEGRPALSELWSPATLCQLPVRCTALVHLRKRHR